VTGHHFAVSTRVSLRGTDPDTVFDSVLHGEFEEALVAAQGSGEAKKRR
jgi:hypothetical protein